MSAYGERIDEHTVRFRRVLPGPVELVWSYLVDSDKRARWLCAGDYATDIGGDVQMRFNNSTLSNLDDIEPPEKYRQVADEVICAGRILACDPPRVLEHTWVFGEDSSVVRYELRPVGEKVELTLTHSRLPTDAHLLSVSGGWHTHLAVLESVLEEDERPDFWATLMALESDYATRFGI